MMRSLLFVPGDSERKMLKAARSGADALILDLEDSVAQARKSEFKAAAPQTGSGAICKCSRAPS